MVNVQCVNGYCAYSNTMDINMCEWILCSISVMDIIQVMHVIMHVINGY